MKSEKYTFDIINLYFNCPQKARTLNKAFDTTKKENVRPRTHKELTSSSISSRVTTSASTHKDSTSSSLHRQHTRIEKHSSSHSKPSFPVTVSYVSIQGGNDQNLELDAIGPDFIQKKHFVRSPTFHDNSFSTLRIERSRTSLVPSKATHSLRLRQGSNSHDNHPHHSLHPQHHPSAHHSHHHNNHHHQAQHHHSHSSPTHNGNSNSNSISRHSQHSSPQDPHLTLSGNGTAVNGKSAWLPKPAMPSPDYLEGHLSVNSNSPGFSPRIGSDLSHLPGGPLEGEVEQIPEHSLTRGRK